MSAPIDFHFDFTSPYAYVASHRIEALAARHGRKVAWRPMLLGPAFAVSGNRPMTEQPLKGDYVLRDVERLCRLHEIPWRCPERLPIATLNAARAFYWLADKDMRGAVRFAKEAFAAYFADGTDIESAEAVVAVAARLGLPPAGVGAALKDPFIKQRLKDETEAAIARGVFGSPFFFVDDEPFWGCDRLGMIDEWLTRGGW